MSATPLLDREQPLPGARIPAKDMAPEEKKKRRRNRLWGWAIYAAVIVTVVIWGPNSENPTRLAGSAGSASLDVLLWLAILILTLYASIWVNALGAVAAGYAAGFQLRHLSMAGFLLERQTRGWRLRFSPRRIFSAYGAMTTLSTEHLARRYIWMFLGGPVATIVLILVALLLPKGDFPQILLFANLGIAALCCIPYTHRGRSSNARLLMILARENAAPGRLTAVLYLLAIDAQGVPPSDWPRDLVEKLDVPPAGTPFFGPSLGLRYAVARASNDPEAIAEALESGLASIDKLPADSRRWFFSTAAGFQASLRGQVPLAEVWLESARKVKNIVLGEEDWDSEALGLIALAKGDSGLARESLTRYLAHVDTRPLPLCGMLVAQRAHTVDLLHQLIR